MSMLFHDSAKAPVIYGVSAYEYRFRCIDGLSTRKFRRISVVDHLYVFACDFFIYFFGKFLIISFKSIPSLGH